MRKSEESQTPQVKALDPEKRLKLVINLASALPQGIPIDRLTDEQLLYWQRHRSELHRGIGAVLLRQFTPLLMSFEVPAMASFNAVDLFRVNLDVEVPIAKAEWFPHDIEVLENLTEKDIPDVLLNESNEDGEDLDDVLRGWVVLRPNKYPLYFGHAHYFLRKKADPTRGYAFKYFWYKGGVQTLYASPATNGWKIILSSIPSGPGD
ncbi:MAG: hypothetical protein Q8Q05_02220 [bacterium]|nr:hypothetical protein [bacterium]